MHLITHLIDWPMGTSLDVGLSNVIFSGQWCGVLHAGIETRNTKSTLHDS